jgi:hypothetical protein
MRAAAAAGKRQQSNKQKQRSKIGNRHGWLSWIVRPFERRIVNGTFTGALQPAYPLLPLFGRVDGNFRQ